jgi:hypothetical protein
MSVQVSVKVGRDTWRLDVTNETPQWDRDRENSYSVTTRQDGHSAASTSLIGHIPNDGLRELLGKAIKASTIQTWEPSQ